MLNDQVVRMPSKISLPDAPAEAWNSGVAVWSEPINIDTYLPDAPDAYPAFLDRRVYQGSSGRVYPLPFHERISQTKHPLYWEAVHVENEWLRVVILPALGGRIHIAYDKVAGYDMFYRNNVIKPALVGLAGPWVSGGIEFNWPQHHRPATFLPTDVEIERDADGAVTVWCSDHDPFNRMKGMHGIRLSPSSSRLEVKVRLYNRSEVPQTFLWWANVAAAVNDHYQSFFPGDVTHVADHAKRAVVTFPRPDAPYYGVDYSSRATAEVPDGDRLDWYRNIPVPTSYMTLDTAQDFFGGYDHQAKAGFVHVARHEISPGKKQWTWGNAPFGWAWDRNLTDEDGPYVELMAGVYTDNQPDFAFIAAGETKTFSQAWFPIRDIGPACFANDSVAVSIRESGDALVIAANAAEVLPGVTVTVTDEVGKVLATRAEDLNPASTFSLILETPTAARDVIVLFEQDRRVIARAQAGRPSDSDAVNPTSQAVAPPKPTDVDTIDELLQIAIYLDQYRHATRSSEPYLNEALRRDPNESRVLTALGAKAYERAEYRTAVLLLTRAAEMVTKWTATPASGEAHYRLGLALGRQLRWAEAAAALSRAFWDQQYAVAARFALARVRCRQGRFAQAELLLLEALEIDPQHLQSADLLATLLAELERRDSSLEYARASLSRDALDPWARSLAGEVATADATTMLDVALEYAGAGFSRRALETLADAAALLSSQPTGQVNVGPLISIHRAALAIRAGDQEAARRAIYELSHSDFRSAHPSRLDDVDAANAVLSFAPDAGVAAVLLGHWYYARGRHTDAIALWTNALHCEIDDRLAAVVHRNLGLAAYNVNNDVAIARDHYRSAVALDPDSAKLIFEQDQLEARAGVEARQRLAILETRPDLIETRDDLTIAFAHLLMDADRLEEARALLASRKFQPWEGGEGQVLSAWDRVTILSARHALAKGDPTQAISALMEALSPPERLGEGRHLLANVSELHLLLGDAVAASGNPQEAIAHWNRAAGSVGDFAEMAPKPYSTNTIHAAVALKRLGKSTEASALVASMSQWLDEYEKTEAEIDFFATSLPNMLLFVEAPAVARDREVAIVRKQIDEWTDASRG